MMRWNRIAGITALTLAAAASTIVHAKPLVIEAEPPLAQRTVLVNATDLDDKAGHARIEDQLRHAAKDVCDRQYPKEPEVLYLRSCYRGSFYDAWAALMKGRESLAAGQMSVAVRAR